MECSHDELAGAFTAEHGTRLRYAAERGAWFVWDGTRYREDRTQEAFDRARATCRAAAEKVEQATLKRATASITAASAVERLARADRVHAISLGDFDRDPWLLNTPKGTFDLRAAMMRRHDPANLITRVTAVAPRNEAPKRWLEFLRYVTGGDDELLGYLQRLAGYALTGDTSEHAFAFLYGPGGNGKGVFLNTLIAILGDYACVAPIETFTAAHGDRHPTELAMLDGARLVTAQETEEGRQWAEARIKSITGGDAVTARFMRRDFFTFQPQFKLVISGNHQPGLRSVDPAIRRRLHIVPFTVTVLEAERDPNLPRELEVEWPEILGWALRGFKAWRETGLAPPAAVARATDKYLAEEEPLTQWLEDSCEIGATAKEIARAAYLSWTAWCRSNGEEPGSEKAFARRLERHGFERKRTRNHRFWLGFKLKRSPDEADRKGDG